MGESRTWVWLDDEMETRLKERAKKLGMPTAQEYIRDVLRRNLSRHRRRPRNLSPDDAFIRKFATPTKESGRIIETERKYGLWK